MITASCCFSQRVSVHQSPAADEVRKDVRARLVVVLRRFSRWPAGVANVAAPVAPGTYDARLDDELRDLD